MRGKITRLLACSPEELLTYKGMDIGPTFVHPNYRHNPMNGDVSASYNKPASVMHFSRESNFTEEFLLFIDADMLLVRDLDPIALGAKPGTVVSEEVGWLMDLWDSVDRFPSAAEGGVQTHPHPTPAGATPAGAAYSK